ncbi:type 1 pili tip component [Parahaliea mediterranea]|uniref:Type 1 pili tip component n=1 Tax=Parahaliea mediterranea TaxID=651086 RepID=A0A939INZ0_9GAMM|nr:type 1 pili tip component [Parahaliea mediterranea]MBN7798618.1 type 1 pili tip component [Parahaliea mediterranea]
MQISELVSHWEQEAAGDLARDHYSVQLPLEDAAKIEALAEMFPRRTREQLITDLLAVALDELVSHLPYVQGSKVIARDEQGDPIFEDVGLTPRYLALTRHHAERLKRG